MIFSREYLNFDEKSVEDITGIHQTLLNAAVAGTKLTIAEAKYTGTFIEAMSAQNAEGRDLLTQIYDDLPDYKFWQTFMRYAKDLNGWGTIKSPRGTVSSLQKRIDAAYLENEFIKWQKIVLKTNHKHTALQFLTKQARDELKVALSWSAAIGEGKFRRSYIEKSVVLYSKYVYIKVEEYYQEYDVKKDTLALGGIEIEVDSFAYAHVLMRHFSPFNKFGRPGLTFHSDPVIDVENLPRNILLVLGTYGQHFPDEAFDQEVLFFRLNGRDYAIWLKKLPKNLPGGNKIMYFRVQTFYPAELPGDRAKIAALTKVVINPGLAFYRTD